jgi:hypothetical protein
MYLLPLVRLIAHLACLSLVIGSGGPVAGKKFSTLMKMDCCMLCHTHNQSTSITSLNARVASQPETITPNYYFSFFAVLVDTERDEIMVLP